MDLTCQCCIRAQVHCSVVLRNSAECWIAGRHMTHSVLTFQCCGVANHFCTSVIKLYTCTHAQSQKISQLNAYDTHACSQRIPRNLVRCMVNTHLVRCTVNTHACHEALHIFWQSYAHILHTHTCYKARMRCNTPERKKLFS